MWPFFRADFGNPSAIHSYGQAAKKALEEARRKVALALGAKSSEIFFVSGGTESDNWAIQSAVKMAKAKGRHIVTSATEHNAVIKPLEELVGQGYAVTFLRPDKLGRIDPSALEAALRDDTILVSLALANNVVGTILDIPALVKVAKKKKVLFHTDAVQAVGHIPVNVRDLGVDLLSISGHKFHGPKGVGVLFAKLPRLPHPYIFGGGQERGGRSGTENVPGAVGLAVALEEAVREFRSIDALIALRDRLIEGTLKIAGAELTGDPVNRLPQIASFVFSALKSSVHLINAMNEVGLCASSGSACSAAANEASHVLMAMGYPNNLARASLRLSLSRYNTPKEIQTVIELLPSLVNKAREKGR
jgi:cysteine desulfurase